MSTETRRTLITSDLAIAAIYFAIGLAGHAAHKLDFTATLLLMFGFAVFSIGITWLQLWDDRRTRERLVHIAARLTPYDLGVNVCKGGVYEIVSQGDLFEEVVTHEPLDLDGLEAFIEGLHHGVFLGQAWRDDGTMEARLARQEAQYSEDKAHIGVDGSYIWRIPGSEN